MALDGRAEARLRAIQETFSRVDPPRQAAANERAAQMPVSCRLGYLRAVAGTTSPREAIRAQCLECVGWVRREVTICTARACPLYAYRPYQGDES